MCERERARAGVDVPATTTGAGERDASVANSTNNREHAVRAASDMILYSIVQTIESMQYVRYLT